MTKILRIILIIIIIIVTISLIIFQANYDNFENMSEDCAFALTKNCFDFNCTNSDCGACTGQPNVQRQLKIAGCTNENIRDWCDNKIRLNTKLTPQKLLTKLQSAYNNGPGVLLSETDLLPTPQNSVLIDASGSVIRKGYNSQIFGVMGNVSFGYLWDPDDMMDIIECTYPTNAMTVFRQSSDGTTDRCGNSTSTPRFPIMCGENTEASCNSSNPTPYCPDNTPDATGLLRCLPTNKCPKPICNEGEDCVKCMLRQGIEKQYPYSNYSQYLSCPKPENSNDFCLDNEVVIDRKRRNSIDYNSAVERWNERTPKAPKPIALFLAIVKDFDWKNGGATCVDLFSPNEAPPPGTIAGTPPSLETIKAQFDCNTIVVVLRNNYLHAPKQTFEDVEFVGAFYLKDIEGKICTKSN